MSSKHEISRRQFFISTAAVGGALVLGFRLPSRTAQAANVAPEPWTSPVAGGQEVNAWLIIGSDDTVTIRVAQSEMGQGVFTSMPMLVAEELECDWTKVRAEYASVNRSLRQNRVYQRMSTGGSRAVRGSREYLQHGRRQCPRPADCRRRTAMECASRRVQGRKRHGSAHRVRAEGQLRGCGCRCGWRQA